MKKLLAMLVISTAVLSSIVYADEVITPDVHEEVQYDTNVGIGRLANTMQKVRNVEVTITLITPYELDPNMNVITIDSPDDFLVGRWLVYPVLTEEAPKNGYWYNLYDKEYHKLGIMAAQKLQ